MNMFVGVADVDHGRTGLISLSVSADEITDIVICSVLAVELVKAGH